MPEKSTLVILVMLFLFKSLQRETQVLQSYKVSFNWQWHEWLWNIWAIKHWCFDFTSEPSHRDQKGQTIFLQNSLIHQNSAFCLSTIGKSVCVLLHSWKSVCNWRPECENATQIMELRTHTQAETKHTNTGTVQAQGEHRPPHSDRRLLLQLFERQIFQQRNKKYFSFRSQFKCLLCFLAVIQSV